MNITFIPILIQFAILQKYKNIFSYHLHEHFSHYLFDYQ